MLATRLGTTYSAEQGLRDVNSSELLELLNWKNLAFKLNKLTLMYNILNNGTAPVFVTSFLHEAIIIITIIFEIMILISRFLNLKKNFLREVSGTEVLYGTVFLMKLKLLNRYILSKG